MSQVLHCTSEHLSDLTETLDAIRAWPGIREPKPGVFYIKQDPFLHFRRSETQRWANARRGINWGKPLVIPTDVTSFDHQRLVRELKDRYLRTSFALSRSVVA